MKKCFALFLSLALLLSCMPAAFAEEIGVVPYEIAALDTVIYIPENMTVTDETETDEMFPSPLRSMAAKTAASASTSAIQKHTKATPC